MNLKLRHSMLTSSTALAMLAVPAFALQTDYSATNGAAFSHITGDEAELNDAEVVATTENSGRAWGVLVHANPNGEASTLVINSSDISGYNSRSHAVQTGAKGSNADGTDRSRVTFATRSNVSTDGADAFALHAIDGTNISGLVSISTDGANGFGAFAESYSSIDLIDSIITTRGTNAFGLIANDDRNAQGGVITARNTTVTTNGSGAHAAFADRNASQITIIGGSLQTEGSLAYGLNANEGSITTTGTSISTAAAWTFGANAMNGGTIVINGGSIETDGLRAYGLLAQDGSTITSSANITTNGEKAHAVQTSTDGGSTRTGGTVNLTGGTITTNGTGSFGLHAIGKGHIGGTSAIVTMGANSLAVFAESDSTISLNGGSVSTRGSGSKAVVANNDSLTVGGSIALTGVTVETHGPDSAGLYADDGGIITFNGGSVTSRGDASMAVVANNAGPEVASKVHLTNTTVLTYGENSAALSASGAGIITLADTYVAANGAGSSAIVIDGSGTVEIGDSELLSIGATAIVNLQENSDVATILFNSGTIADQNNGTLLQVNRTADSSDAIVNFTINAGAVASGDIVDIGPINNGATYVQIDAAAVYSGQFIGITDFTAGSGSTTNFGDDSIINGDITAFQAVLNFGSGVQVGGSIYLEEGSTVSGGTITNPIVVGGNFSIFDDARLGGNLNIGGYLINRGIVAPGNSLGVINIAGDLDLAPTSVLQMEIAASGQSDFISVGGTATLDGTLEIQLLDPRQSYRSGTSYNLIEVAGDIDGEFQNVIQPLYFVTATVDYQPNAIGVTISVDDDAFANVAVTSNQAATANGLASLAQTGDALTLYNSIAMMTGPEAARVAFEQFAGESYASVKTGLIENGPLLSDAVNDRIRATADTEGSAGWNLWMSGLGSWIQHGKNANVGDLKSSTGGLLFGVDVNKGDNLQVGIVGGYSQSKFRMEQRSAATESDNYHLGAYAGLGLGVAKATFGANYSWHKLNATRNLSFFGDVHSADYKARTLQAHADLSYPIAAGPIGIEPFAGVNHVSLRTRSANEKGGLAALNINGDKTDTTFTTVGIRLSTPLNIAKNEVRLRGMAGWRHALGDIVPTSTHSFNASDEFTVDGVSIAKDVATVELGFDARVAQNARFSIGYFGRFGDQTTQNGVKASLAVAF